MKLRPLSLIAAGCAGIALFVQAQLAPVKTAPAPVAEPRTPVEHRRASENTYLTFPEWFLVYSPDEYADFIADRPPSAFPYFGHIGQFWQGYRAMYNATKDDYPFNLDYHVMVMVIGTSTTLEYALKFGYENIVGRATEATRWHGLTAEDKLAAKVARDYVDFLDVEPWYKFDFVGPLRRLWSDTGFWSDDPIRSWERKYFLTSEYAAKAGYAWVIKVLSESQYGVEAQETTVLLDRTPTSTATLPKLKVLKEHPDGSVLAQLPRYQAFTKSAQVLARADLKFVEIAGNRGPIVVSAIVPTDFDDTGYRMIMKQPILTRPGTQRIVFTVSVGELLATVRTLDHPWIQLEHIYDY